MGRVARADAVSACAGLGAVASVRAWLDGEEVRLAALVAQQSSVPERDIAVALRVSDREGLRALERAAVAAAFPELVTGMSAGLVSGAHLDVLRREASAGERVALQPVSAELAAVAAASTAAEFAREVRRRVRAMRDREERLRAQQAATSLRWRVRPDGMTEWTLLLDPTLAPGLANRIAAATEALFSEATPPDCPTDTVAKQAFLRAHALLRLVNGQGMRMNRPEMVIVVDTRQPDGPTVDWGIPVEVPERVLLDLARTADAHVVVVRNGVVLHAPGVLDLGRTTRLANSAQRRVLRALYATCAVPGCAVRYDNCHVHYVVWWRHGGFTDLANLVPLCSRHHGRVHKDGWLLSLAPDRTLTVTLPDGRVMTTGPPGRVAA